MAWLIFIGFLPCVTCADILFKEAKLSGDINRKEGD